MENANAELAVTLGNTWYKQVAYSVALGTFVSFVTYAVQRTAFNDSFHQVRVESLNPVD